TLAVPGPSEIPADPLGTAGSIPSAAGPHTWPRQWQALDRKGQVLGTASAYQRPLHSLDRDGGGRGRDLAGRGGRRRDIPADRDRAAAILHNSAKLRASRPAFRTPGP